MWSPDEDTQIQSASTFCPIRTLKQYRLEKNHSNSKKNSETYRQVVHNTMELTLNQLKQYDGTDPSKPIYIGVRGRIFDVSTAKSFYGPGGSYALFAGKDATRALAKMSKNDEDVIGSLDGLTDKELGILADWERKFEAKYPIVGSLSA